MSRFFINFLRLTRPLSNAKTFAVIALAFYLSGKDFILDKLVLGALSLFLLFCGIYAYNTICDADPDKNNKNKRHYAESVSYFGEKSALAISFFLVIISFILGSLINIYFLSVLILSALTGFLYSSPKTRFKEKPVLDIIFGAALTFPLRFIASWFIFTVSFPPLLPIFGLAFLKSAGYMLYKMHDRAFLASRGIKNSVTLLSEKAVMAISALFFSLAGIFFTMLCLNGVIFNLVALGYLPFKFLVLLPLFVPPILLQYMALFKKITLSLSHARTIGFVLLLIIVIAVLFFA